jgi:hypothetical protein
MFAAFGAAIDYVDDAVQSPGLARADQFVDVSVTLRRRLALNHEQVNRPARVRRLELAQPRAVAVLRVDSPWRLMLNSGPKGRNSECAS